MKYLCLVAAEQMLEAYSEADAAQHMHDYADFIEALERNGQLLAKNRLQPPETAVTVRVRDGQTSTTDGPFAETKEHIGGYFLIEARDLNEAISIAARIPGCWRGCVEVRPIAEDAITLEALGLET
jgi:hypothetical protein